MKTAPKAKAKMVSKQMALRHRRFPSALPLRWLKVLVIQTFLPHQVPVMGHQDRKRHQVSFQDYVEARYHFKAQLITPRPIRNARISNFLDN